MAKLVAYVIEWSEEDQTYIGTIPSLPGCTAHGDTIPEAMKALEDAKREWVEEANRLGPEHPVNRPPKPVAHQSKAGDS